MECGGIEISKFFIDTNILWWYFAQNSKYHEKVKNFLDPLILDLKNSFFVNEFVIIELLHILIKRTEAGYSLGKKILSNQYSFLNIIIDINNIRSLEELLEVLNIHGHNTTIGGRDSSIIVSMRLHKINNIITHDDGFRSVDDINIHDPIF